MTRNLIGAGKLGRLRDVDVTPAHNLRTGHFETQNANSSSFGDESKMYDNDDLVYDNLRL